MDKQREMQLILDSIADCRTAVVTGPAAARLMGVKTLNWVTRTDVVLLNGAKPRLKFRKGGKLIYRSGILKPEEVGQIDGIAVVKPARMLLDVLRYYGRLECLVAIESMRNQWPEKYTRESLLDSCSILPRAKGVRELRELILYSVNTSQSPLETVARDRLLKLPEVVSLAPQAEIHYWGDYREPCRSKVDFLVNGFLVAEVDGREKYSGKYGTPQSVIRAEKTRENGIQAEGFPIVRGDWDTVFDGIFERRVADILKAEKNKKYARFRRSS